MKSTTTFACALSAFVLLGGSASVQAQDTFVPNDAVINYAVPADAFIGEDSSFTPSGPTVSLVTGGSIGGDLHTLNTSTLNVTGGSIAGRLTAGQSSIVNLSGGTIVGEVAAYDSSVVNITGGSIGGDLDASVAFYSHFNFYGIDLVASLVDPGDPTDPDNVVLYSLSGTLLDGTVLSGKSLDVTTVDQFTIFNRTSAVPEPGCVALLGGMGLMGANLLLRRRKR